jgi:large subunit ribosomal protein L29
MNKHAEKFRNLGPVELNQAMREHMDQLFRLKFQMKMGQTESLNKIRTLRRNVARLKTISRQHQLGIVPAAGAAKAGVSKVETKPKAAATARPVAKKTAAKKTAKKTGKR